MGADSVLKTIAAAARQHDMLPEGGLVLAAVSGGADSMCLLHALQQLAQKLGFRLAAAHYDHRLRGEESAADAAFVAEYCRRAGIPFTLGSGDVAACAAETRRGTEETAREMRYAFLEETARRLGASRIATAHTADDNGETVLLHLARGAGLRGLCGIPPVRGSIVRPMLQVTRREVEAYLAENGLSYRQDASNETDDYARNRVRHAAVPVLREINPGFSRTVSAACVSLAEDEAYLTGLAQAFLNDHLDGDALPAADLAALPRPIGGRVVRILCPGADAGHVAAVLALAAGEDPSARADLPGLTVHREYDRVVFAPPETGTFQPAPLAPGGALLIPEAGVRITCTTGEMPGKINKYFNTFLFKTDAICGTLWVRPRRAGDYITLPGRPRKPLKKLFMEARIPAARRAAVPVLADENGPLAVYGLGCDVRAAAQPGDRILTINFEEISENDQRY